MGAHEGLTVRDQGGSKGEAKGWRLEWGHTRD